MDSVARHVACASGIADRASLFACGTALKETAVLATPAEEFQPSFSPDGKEVAYLEDRALQWSALPGAQRDAGQGRLAGPGPAELQLNAQEQAVLNAVGVDPTAMSTEEKVRALRTHREAQYEKLMDAVYARRGWTQDGVPTLAKLKELGVPVQYEKFEGYPHTMDIALEVNTSGFVLRGEPFPSSRVVKEAQQLGVRLEAGSDAHRPEHVGRYFDWLPGLVV